MTSQSCLYDRDYCLLLYFNELRQNSWTVLMNIRKAMVRCASLQVYTTVRLVTKEITVVSSGRLLHHFHFQVQGHFLPAMRVNLNRLVSCTLERLLQLHSGLHACQEPQKASELTFTDACGVCAYSRYSLCEQILVRHFLVSVALFLFDNLCVPSHLVCNLGTSKRRYLHPRCSLNGYPTLVVAGLTSCCFEWYC